MEEILTYIILQALEAALTKAIETGISYIIKKVVDEAGNIITQIVYEFDSDGDGVNDSEQVIYTLDSLIPNLDDGYCLVNKGNEIGLGLPQFEIIDGSEISNLIDTQIVTGNDNGFIVDIDFDGEKDDVLVPLPDFTGDGIPDWGWLVDRDDNGLPDASPFAPFYPVGSDGYRDIVSRVSTEEYTIMNKPLKDYTVTEGILLIFLIACSFKFFSKLFRRKKVVTIG